MSRYSDITTEQIQQPGILDESSAERLAALFSAFADPSRVRILSVILNQECCVSDIASATGLSESATSHQLRTLRQMRLVRTRREGRMIFYTLDDDHVAGLLEMAMQHAEHS